MPTPESVSRASTSSCYGCQTPATGPPRPSHGSDGRRDESQWWGVGCSSPGFPSLCSRGVAPEEATIEDIEYMLDEWSEAARRVKDAGFDAVEIHGAHGYSLTQWLSPRDNRRTDGYGGSQEKRARFACELIARVMTVYLLTLTISTLILFAIDRLPLVTDPLLALKRVVLVSFPAVFAATVVDSLHD